MHHGNKGIVKSKSPSEPKSPLAWTILGEVLTKIFCTLVGCAIGSVAMALAIGSSVPCVVGLLWQNCPDSYYPNMELLPTLFLFEVVGFVAGGLMGFGLSRKIQVRINRPKNEDNLPLE